MKASDPLTLAIDEADSSIRLGRRAEAKTVLARALTTGAKRGFFGKMKKTARSASHVEAARRFAALVAAGSSADDLSLLARLAQEHPEDATIRRAHAASLSSAGRRAEAVAEYEEWIRTTPGDGAALAAVAREYAVMGKREEALERYGRALDSFLADRRVEAACEAARNIATLSPGSLEDAARVVRLAREGDPLQLPLALERYAVLCHGEGKMGQEAEAWSELAELCPDRLDVRENLTGAYTRILDGDPGDEVAWRGLEQVDPGLASQLHVILMPAGD